MGESHYVCLFSLLICALLPLPLKLRKDANPLNTCLSFVGPTKLILLTTVVTWVVVISQTLTFIAVFVTHISLVAAVKESAKNITKSQTKAQSLRSTGCHHNNKLSLLVPC